MTIIPFIPSLTASPPFQATFTLDGANYLGSVRWNIAGQRFYFTLTDQNGNLIWNGALVASPANFDIYLAPGIFKTSTLLFRDGTNNFEQTP
ncbi:MAG: hypothetical protein G3I10_09160 [Ferrovum sp.]|nr:hypothetical protein [Ferrovum sp.]